MIQSGKLYKYDIKENGIRGEAWIYDKAYFSDGSGEMRIDYDNKISINRGGYLTKTYFHYTIGFRIVRTV